MNCAIRLPSTKDDNVCSIVGEDDHGTLPRVTKLCTNDCRVHGWSDHWLPNRGSVSIFHDDEGSSQSTLQRHSATTALLWLIPPVGRLSPHIPRDFSSVSMSPGSPLSGSPLPIPIAGPQLERRNASVGLLCSVSSRTWSGAPSTRTSRTSMARLTDCAALSLRRASSRIVNCS